MGIAERGRASWRCCFKSLWGILSYLLYTVYVFALPMASSLVSPDPLTNDDCA